LTATGNKANSSDQLYCFAKQTQPTSVGKACLNVVSDRSSRKNSHFIFGDNLGKLQPIYEKEHFFHCNIKNYISCKGTTFSITHQLFCC